MFCQDAQALVDDRLRHGVAGSDRRGRSIGWLGRSTCRSSTFAEHIEQHTIAASSNLLVSSPRIEPVSEKSWFRLTPVAATAGCKDISLQSRPTE